ncbi:MAG TPA: choice-of-anchor Q domain-containing protein [Gemmataceae bacterium]|nr:choice-of-anchor Q domain-containing protein [Gemmataceae bacterium]
MILRSWIQKLIQPTPRSHARGRRPEQPLKRWPTLLLEVLEDRLTPAGLGIDIVTNNADSGSGSLRQAIQNSNSGDTILFSPSMAGQTILLTSGELVVVHNLKIIGLGADLLTVSGNNASRIFEIENPATQAQITGLTMTAGRAKPNNLDDGGGGAIRVYGSVLTLTDVTITNCTAQGDNGMHPGAFGFGGGIFNLGTLNLIGCALYGNQAIGGDGQSVASSGGGGGGGAARGGAICTLAGTLNITNSTITGNSAIGGNGGNANTSSGEQTRFGGNGGGLGGGGGTVGMNDPNGDPGQTGGNGTAEFPNYGGGGGGAGAIATGSGGNGGSAFFGGGGGGGGAAGPSGPAAGEGGASFSFGGAGGNGQKNQAGTGEGGGGGGGAALGGGIYVGTISSSNTNSVTITSSTIANNAATGGKGGIGFTNGVGGQALGGGVCRLSGTVTLDSTILAKNTATGPDPNVANFGPDGYGAFTDSGYNLIQNPAGILNSIAATDITGVDPLLSARGNYGGPTQTMALGSGSPAINKGDPNNHVTTDQRGAVRGASSGPGSMANAGTAPDIGAWEASSLNIVTANFIGGIGDSSNVGTLRDAIEWANFSSNPLVPNSTPNLVMFDTTGVFAMPQTITLGIGQLTLSNTTVPESINGPGVTGGSALTVSGNNAARVFQVNSSVTATISGMTITQGSIFGIGGGIFNQGALTLSSVTVSNSYGYMYGGGIGNNTGGNLTVTNSTIVGNKAGIYGYGGGIANLGGASLTVTNSTISGNKAGFGGGGMAQKGPGTASTITNTTLSGNSSPFAGGTIEVFAGTLKLFNSTLANNVSGLTNSGGTLMTRDTILSGNSGGDVSGNIGSQGHNLIQNPSGGSGFAASDILNVNPRLLTLANNGGPTQTMGLGFSHVGDPGYPANSAVDAGDNSSAPSTDQRGTGFSRIINGTIDIGAFEDQLVTTAPVSPQTAPKGMAQTFTLGSFSDLAPVSSYSVTIFWGDGSMTPLTLTSQGTIPSQMHTYSAIGNYTVLVQVSDADGDTGQKTFSVSVSTSVLSAMAVNISPTAGAPFTGAVATFTDPSGPGPLSSYSASIAWGDNSGAVAGTITLSGGVFTVTASHTYAAAASDTMTITLYRQGMPTTVQGTATVSSLGQFVQAGLIKPISFWAGLQGQELVRRFGLTSAGQTLGQWLATTFPNLYGGANGAPNLSPFTNAQISSYYLSLFLVSKGVGLDSEVLATALEVFTTTLSLGGTTGQAYGFTVNSNGLGAYSWNIGTSGQAFGVSNNTVLDVYQILLTANNTASGGEPWSNNTLFRNEAYSVFHGINGG